MSSAALDKLIDKEDPTNLFNLHEELAEGSFGVVYSGTYMKTGDTVAVKIISLEEGETFDDLVIEIDILKHCVHPNIVKYYGAWKKDNELFIAMELCLGGSIAECCHENDSPLNEIMSKYALRESLTGLKYMHDSGIIHRDLKGANVLVSADGSMKLADFGVSARLSKENPVRGTFVGTPFWMAPEVIASKSFGNTYNEISDIWSMGIMAIEFAEKRTPLCELNPMVAIFKIPTLPAPTFTTPSLWSQEFNHFLGRCLVKEPSERAGCVELLSHRFLSDVPPDAPRQMAAFVKQAKDNAAKRRQVVAKAKGKASTMRGNRPTTVRKGDDNRLAERAVRKALRKQMALIQRAQKQQRKARDQHLKRQEKERKDMERTHDKRIDKFVKYQTSEEEKVLKVQRAEMASLVKEQDKAIKMLKQQQEADTKVQLRAFREKLSKEKKAGVNKKIKETEFLNQVAMQHLIQIFRLKQQHEGERQKKARSDHQALSNMAHDAETKRHAEKSEQLDQRHKLAKQHSAELQELQTKGQHDKHQIEKDELTKQIKLQQKALRKQTEAQIKQIKSKSQQQEILKRAQAQARELEGDQLTAQAQEHKMQRRQLNEQIVHADERFEIMKENQRLVFRKQCAQERINALQHFQAIAQRELLAHQTKISEMRQQLAQEMLQLRRQQIDDELRLIKKLDPQSFDAAREAKSKQLATMMREEELKRAQLAEKHAQQRQAFMSRVKQQLKDIRAHYADLHAQQPKPLHATVKAERAAPAAKEAPIDGTMMLQSTARIQPTSGVDNDLGTVMFATSEFATSIIGRGNDDGAGGGDSFADSFESATVAPKRGSDVQETPSFADSFDSPTIAPARNSASLASSTPTPSSTPSFADSFDGPDEPKADAEPDFAASFDTVVINDTPAAAAAAAKAKPEPAAAKVAKKSNPKRSSLSVSSSAVERLPDGWVELTAPDGRTYYQNNIERKTQWKRPTVRPASPALPSDSSSSDLSSSKRPELNRRERTKNLRAGALSKKGTSASVDRRPAEGPKFDSARGREARRTLEKNSEPDFAKSFDSEYTPLAAEPIDEDFGVTDLDDELDHVAAPATLELDELLDSDDIDEDAFAFPQSPDE